MNFPAFIFTLRCLIQDTFRQAQASGVLYLMTGVTALCTFVCLSVGVSGDLPDHDPGEHLEVVSRTQLARLVTADQVTASIAFAVQPDGWRLPLPPSTYTALRLEEAHRCGVVVVGGEVTVLFGAFSTPISRDRACAVRFLQLQMIGWVADAAGVMLALIWTAGFLPSFLDPRVGSVLLSKPSPRWLVLFGKYIGVLAFVAIQAALFVACLFTALGVRTGIWDPTCFLCVPLLLIHFAIFYSVSSLLAVLTRSPVVCVFGCLAFWMLCWGFNFGRLVSETNDLALSPVAARSIEVAYWVLPKPADLGLLLVDALGARADVASAVNLTTLEAHGGWRPLFSLATSTLFALVVLTLAGRRVVRTDY